MRLKGARRTSTLQKVINLATHFQMMPEEEEELSADKIKAIGADLGLPPEAVSRIYSSLEVELQRLPKKRAKDREQFRIVLAFLLPVFWGALSLLLSHKPGAEIFFVYLSAPFMAGFVGFLAGKRELGKMAAGLLVFVLSFTIGFPFMIPYLAIGLGIGQKLGEQGASVYEEMQPKEEESESISEERLKALLARTIEEMKTRSEGGGTAASESSLASKAGASGSETMSREALLRQLFEIQGALEKQKQHRVFLSIDVVGSSEMASGGPELAVEYSFLQFRRWVEEIVKSHDGKIQSAAGDGVMCLFSEGPPAVRAARDLQMGIDGFNSTYNHLPRPFQIRCGLSSGAVAIDDGVSFRDVQSPAIYRAAVMQKRADPGDILVSEEMAAEALTELQPLAPVSTPEETSQAFSWQAGRRTIQK